MIGRLFWWSIEKATGITGEDADAMLDGLEDFAEQLFGKPEEDEDQS